MKIKIRAIKLIIIVTKITITVIMKIIVVLKLMKTVVQSHIKSTSVQLLTMPSKKF